MKRIGIVGVGKMGLSHFAIANTTPGLQVVAIAESNNMLARLISKYSNVRSYEDYSVMMQVEDLDGVIISLPNKLHYNACTMAIEKGLSYFVEKPFTINAEHSVELMNKTCAAGIQGQVGYVNRFNPMFQKLRILLDEKVVGTVYQYQASMLGSVVTSESKQNWRTTYADGGGCLFDYGSHCIDLIQFLFGAIAEVSASKLESIFSKDAEDCVFASFIQTNGCSGQMIVNWCDLSQRKAYNEVKIWGSMGKVIANKQEIKIYLGQENEELALHQGWNIIYGTDIPSSVPFYLRGEDFARQMIDFCNGLNNPTYPLISSAASAASVDHIIQLIRDANAQGAK